MQQNAYFRVAVTDGTIVDDNLGYVRDAIRFDCGHNHRTEEAAEKCREKLLNWSKDRRECSAKWYNAKILRTDCNGKHLPPTQKELTAEFPGFCMECGASVPDAVGGTLCPTCEAKWATK